MSSKQLHKAHISYPGVNSFDLYSLTTSHPLGGLYFTVNFDVVCP